MLNFDDILSEIRESFEKMEKNMKEYGILQNLLPNFAKNARNKFPATSETENALHYSTHVFNSLLRAAGDGHLRGLRAGGGGHPVERRALDLADAAPRGGPHRGERGTEVGEDLGAPGSDGGFRTGRPLLRIPVYPYVIIFRSSNFPHVHPILLEVKKSYTSNLKLIF